MNISRSHAGEISLIQVEINLTLLFQRGDRLPILTSISDVKVDPRTGLCTNISALQGLIYYIYLFSLSFISLSFPQEEKKDYQFCWPDKFV